MCRFIKKTDAEQRRSKPDSNCLSTDRQTSVGRESEREKEKEFLEEEEEKLKYIEYEFSLH